MNEIEKLLRMIPLADRIRIQEANAKMFSGDVDGLSIKKLSASDELFRVRVGNYRLLYIRKNGKWILQTIRRRNESTYR